MNLFSELKRRRVFRLAAAYVAGAFGALLMRTTRSARVRRPERTGAFVMLPLLLLSCFLPPPDLTEADWVQIRVEYCTATDPGIIWTSTDATILQELRGLMKHEEPRGRNAIFPSYSNEIEIRLANHQRWLLYFRETRRRFNFHDPDEPVRSFTVNVTPDFYDRLGELLEAPLDISRAPCKMPRYL